MSELRLTGGAELALGRAQELCEATNTGIVAPEHLLAGALIVLAQEDAMPGIPDLEAVVGALVATLSVGEEPLEGAPMFGSSAREALSVCVRTVQQRGSDELAALDLAFGTIASGEVNPMFYDALQMSKQDLISILGA